MFLAKNQILACKCGVEKVMFTAMNMHKGDTILYECALNVLKTMSIKSNFQKNNTHKEFNDLFIFS